MAISTYKTFLMKKDSVGSTWEKVIDIKEFPNLGGEPEMLDTTTLTDGMYTYIPGIQKAEGMTFKGNYTKADYDKVKALEGKEEEYAVWFGATVEGAKTTPTGSDGKFEFKGIASVFVNGGGVNAVVDMTVTIAPTTPIVAAAGA